MKTTAAFKEEPKKENWPGKLARDQMTLDSDSDADQGEMAMLNNSTKSADQVHNTVAKWGKGTECVIEWGFRQNSESYKLKGTVVGRTARKGNRLQVSTFYLPNPKKMDV